MSKQKQKCKLNPQWIRETRDYLLEFLEVTKFPHPIRNGTRGSEFDYPEWLIMFIAVLSVKCKVKTYLGIHRLTAQYWKVLIEGQKIKKELIAESTLRGRLKKICHSARKPAKFIFQIYSPEDLR